MTTHKYANETINGWLRSAQISPAIGKAPAALKKIIDGKTYNTSTASLLSSYAYDKTRDQYEWLWEDLYQTRNGAFFLVGEGMSEHTPFGARLPGTNDYIRGHALLPLDEHQAKKWLEIRDRVDDYAEIFAMSDDASNEDNSSSFVMTLRLPRRLAEKMKMLCKDNESLQSFVQNAVEVACKHKAA